MATSDRQPPKEPGAFVSLGSQWQYSVGAAPRNWKNGLPAAKTARAELGFGEFETTTLPQGKISYYFTQKFNVTDADDFKQLDVAMLVDDGAVIYLNGTEVKRFNMPAGAINSRTQPRVWLYGNNERYRDFKIPAAALKDGQNVVAVEVHNYWSGNLDLSFDLALTEPN